MLNRIKDLMEKKALSASQFADGMDVPRAVLSHILSGRNKPSLDVVLKIADTYNDVSLEWLLLGKGEMLTNLATKSLGGQEHTTTVAIENNDTSSFQKQNESSGKVQKNVVAAPSSKSEIIVARGIKQVMVFYTDGTFEVFDPAG